MQIAVLSGKGGTGKTTIAVGLAETIIKDNIKIDCDVDANNMYLYYNGEEKIKEDFFSGVKAFIDKNKCIKCKKCIENCKFNAINDNFEVDNFKCEGCKVCSLVCPVNAVDFNENKVAKVIEEKLKDDTCLIKADMCVGADSSGKLITELIYRSKKYDNVIKIIDGSPGIGCPVIATITGSDICIIVTEPSMSGLSDLERIYKLSLNFNTKVFVCINKYDINTNVANKIEKYCKDNKIDIIGKIPYDNLVPKSINNLKPIVLYNESLAGIEIKKISERLMKYIERKEV